MTSTRAPEHETPAGVLEHARALRKVADRAETECSPPRTSPRPSTCPNALDLEAALQAGAARLAADGSTEPLAVRRAQALGLLARGQLTLTDQRSGGPATRRITLHLHAAAEALASGLVRVEETGGFVLIDTLAAWCTDPATQLDVHPAIDLADHIQVNAYEVG
jgi:hypothetical protein